MRARKLSLAIKEADAERLGDRRKFEHDPLRAGEQLRLVEVDPHPIGPGALGRPHRHRQPPIVVDQARAAFEADALGEEGDRLALEIVAGVDRGDDRAALQGQHPGFAGERQALRLDHALHRLLQARPHRHRRVGQFAFEPVGQRVQPQQAVEPRFRARLIGRRAPNRGSDAKGRALRKGGLGPADQMGLQHHRPGAARSQIVEIDEPQQGRRRQK